VHPELKLNVQRCEAEKATLIVFAMLNVR
jgi:hypothetical protein